MRTIELNSLQLNAVTINSAGERWRGSHAGAPPVVPDVPDIPEEPDVPSDPEVDENGYIIFADPEVKRVLLANGVGDGVGITKEAAAAVTDIRAWFEGNTAITSFDEFEMFTGVISIGTEEWRDWKAAFKGCSELESITLPSSLRQIGYDVFRDCVKLTSVNIYNVTRIWYQAFYNCGELHIDVVMPNATVVGLSAFANSGINRVLNLGSITSLAGGWGADEGVFRKCKSLTVAILPETLTNIDIQVFAGCDALEALIVKNPTPPTCGVAVLGGSGNCKIYVPDVASEAYKTATNWSAYASRIFPISQLPSNNPRLYAEIQMYIKDIFQLLKIKPTSQDVFETTVQVVTQYKGVDVSPRYSVDKSDIATISDSGLLTFAQEGSVTVTAEYNGEIAIESYNYIYRKIKVNETESEVTIPVVGGHQIEWGEANGHYKQIYFYNDAGSRLDYFNPSGTSRTITAPAASASALAYFPNAYMDTAYVYDATEGKYLWKGKLVE